MPKECALFHTDWAFEAIRSYPPATKSPSAHAGLSKASRYTVMNGGLYMANGVLIMLVPGLLQIIFMEPAFVGRSCWFRWRSPVYSRICF
jgi:hypothetical protein